MSRKTVLLAAAAGLVLEGAAGAQTGAAQSGVANLDFAGDIVVTALRRSTTIQETPISISAVTGEAIADSGVQSIADLGATTPSLNFVDGGPSFRRVVIRGIQGPGEPMVGTYYDETPVTGMVGASNNAGGSTPELRLFDVERVEVLRGPQGTLYGSGSMGGTLRIIYRKPVLDLVEGAVDTSLSNTSHGGWNYEMNAMANLPVVTDRVGLRVTGFYRRQGGYIDNVVLGIDHINELKTYGGRALLRMVPDERWTIDLAAFINGTRADSSSWDLLTGKYQSAAMARGRTLDDTRLFSATSNYDLDFATFTAAGSYMHRRLDSVGDVSRFMQWRRTPGNCASLVNGSAANACTSDQLSDFYDLVDWQAYSALYPQQKMNAYTAELRLASNGSGPLGWSVGGFYADRAIYVTNPQVLTDRVTGEVIRPLVYTTERHLDDSLSQIAGFGELSYDITSQLNITVGARYFHYDKEIVGETTVPSIIVGARITPPTTVQASENGWVKRVNASYKISRDVMVYAEAAQGFRPGGANQVLGLASALTGYGSDSLWNYEAGLKTSLFDRRMNFNVDAFRIDWTDMQITQRTPDGAFGYIGNAGGARVSGIEVETSIVPVEGLTLAGNFSYMDPKLTVDQNTGTTATSGLKGDRIPNVPKYMGGGSAQYVWPLSASLSGYLRADFSHSGDYWTDFRPSYVYARHIDSRTLANARIGIEDPDNRWGAYLFVTNVFNSAAILSASASAISSGNNLAYPGRTTVISATPRTVGINLRGNF